MPNVKVHLDVKLYLCLTINTGKKRNFSFEHLTFWTPTEPSAPSSTPLFTLWTVRMLQFINEYAPELFKSP